jgi:CBS domain-containing protein
VAHRLGVGVTVASAFFQDENKSEAEAAVDRFAEEIPGAERLIIAAEDPQAFVSQLPARSLLILGAPGGSFLSRTFFGPGARLRAAAAAGAVMVRYAGPRVFHLMEEPVFVSPLHHAGDILRLHDAPVLAVVENGSLVGTVRRGSLMSAEPSTPVGDLMESPHSVRIDEILPEAGSLDDDSVAVTDGKGRMLGTLRLASL